MLNFSKIFEKLNFLKLIKNFRFNRSSEDLKEHSIFIIKSLTCKSDWKKESSRFVDGNNIFFLFS